MYFLPTGPVTGFLPFPDQRPLGSCCHLGCNPSCLRTPPLQCWISEIVISEQCDYSKGDNLDTNKTKST